MNDTYTFTARSSEEPSSVATFTLDNDELRVSSATEPVEQVNSIVQSVGSGGTAGQVGNALQPVAGWTLRQLGQDFYVNDVSGSYNEKDGLTLRIWTRIGGLRFVPLTYRYPQVDNPDAARAFVDELQDRAKASDQQGTLPGILDYWLTWIAAGAVAAFAITRKKQNS